MLEIWGGQSGCFSGRTAVKKGFVGIKKAAIKNPALTERSSDTNGDRDCAMPLGNSVSPLFFVEVEMGVSQKRMKQKGPHKPQD
jgi:hypothetical protein